MIFRLLSFLTIHVVFVGHFCFADCHLFVLEYKMLSKFMVSFAVDFDGCKIKPKSQDVGNYDLTASLIPVCHCIIPSHWAAFFNIKSPLTNNVLWAQSKQNKLYQLCAPQDLDWKRAFSIRLSDVSHHMGVDWITDRFQSNYDIIIGPW